MKIPIFDNQYVDIFSDSFATEMPLQKMLPVSNPVTPIIPKVKKEDRPGEPEDGGDLVGIPTEVPVAPEIPVLEPMVVMPEQGNIRDMLGLKEVNDSWWGGFWSGLKAGAVELAYKFSLPAAWATGQSEFAGLADARQQAWQESGIAGTWSQYATQSFANVGVASAYAAGAVAVGEPILVRSIGNKMFSTKQLAMVKEAIPEFLNMNAYDKGMALITRYYTGWGTGITSLKYIQGLCPTLSGGLAVFGIYPKFLHTTAVPAAAKWASTETLVIGAPILGGSLWAGWHFLDPVGTIRDIRGLFERNK